MKQTLIVSTCLVLFGAPNRSPQQPEAHDSDRPFVLRQQVEEVLLYCSVIDRNGKPLDGLGKANFAVLEDGKAVVISHFAHEDVPISLSLVLDRSASMQSKQSIVDAAAETIASTSKVEDETSITNFADTSYLDQQLTSEKSKLHDAISRSSSVSGGTALFDTIITSSNQLAAQARQKKQVVVAITDGKDNASIADLADAVKRVQREDGPVIYVIGLLFDLPASDARKSHKDLSTLADETGGVALFPATPDEARLSAQRISDDIRHQYTLAFHPTKKALAGTFHPISVKVISRTHGRVSIRTRKGYFRNEPLPPAHH